MIAIDTIAAISSAVGPAARMIVRLSGAAAFNLAGQLCPGFASAPAAVLRLPMRLDSFSVPITVYCFVGPRSYTGEDLVEFHLPGNPLIAKLALDHLLARGARGAEPGEFTARAYFHGRIDLTEAEGVAATIAASNEQQLRAARQLLSGELARRLAPVLDGIAQTLALVEVGIDFTEEDVSFLSTGEIRQRLGQADGPLRSILENSERFERIGHEPTFVLVGRPNAGKSTLLNALSGRPRAVVSPVAGTTRDAVSAEVTLPRGIVRLIDVAGLDDVAVDLPPQPSGESPSASIDRQMRSRAIREIESADFVVLVVAMDDGRPQLASPRQPDLLVLSKADLIDSHHASDVAALKVSAASGLNMIALRDRLDALAFGPAGGGSTLALNARHLRAIAECRLALARAIQSADAPAELLAVDLREALERLGSILGNVSPDDLLGRIFSAFCIGK